MSRANLVAMVCHFAQTSTIGRRNCFEVVTWMRTTLRKPIWCSGATMNRWLCLVWFCPSKTLTNANRKLGKPFRVFCKSNLVHGRNTQRKFAAMTVMICWPNASIGLEWKRVTRPNRFVPNSLLTRRTHHRRVCRWSHICSRAMSRRIVGQQWTIKSFPHVAATRAIRLRYACLTIREITTACWYRRYSVVFPAVR